jgi:hypothetical protein
MMISNVVVMIRSLLLPPDFEIIDMPSIALKRKKEI